VVGIADALDRPHRAQDGRFSDRFARHAGDAAESLMRREGVRCINSTSKSIEEIATTILRGLRIPRHVY
jgi:regulator of PEP synthase PpsR (kinase-PPPase family)